MSDKQTPYRLDAGEGVFFARELEYVKSKTYDTKQKLLKALQLIPISTEGGNGITEITYQKYTGVGFAKVIADYAKDFPRVDVYGEEVTVKVKGIGTSYGYSIKEIRSSQRSGKQLDARRAAMAKRANDQKVNSIAFSGDTKTGLNGLISYPGITEATIPADGTGSSKLWSTKTPDQIVRDVTNMVNAVMVTTNGVEAPDTMLLPLEQYNHIANTKMSTNSDLTILSYILKNSPVLKVIEWVVELDGAGASSTDRVMVYTRDEDHLTLEIPQPFEQFEAQKDGMEFKIPCHSETAGVIVYYPLAVAYGDGI